MIELCPLEIWHIELLNNEGLIAPEVYSEEYAKYLVVAGTAVAVFLDGVLVGAGGVINLWKDVAEGWTIISERLRSQPIALVKAFKAFFNENCPVYRRIQITVVEGFEKAEAFAEYLGFTSEGRMLYYSPTGETHTRYARINHG